MAETERVVQFTFGDKLHSIKPPEDSSAYETLQDIHGLLLVLSHAADRKSGADIKYRTAADSIRIVDTGEGPVAQW